MKRPFESITGICLESLERVRENQLYNFSNSEKFMVWLVGFSIGGLSLIFTNLTEINTLYSHQTIKFVLYLLAISVLTGIIYRWSFYKFQQHYQNIEFYLKGAFSDAQMMQTNPYDLSTEEDINEIIYRLKADFDLDYSYILETYQNLDITNQEIIKSNLKNNYKRFGESVVAEVDFTMNYVERTFAKAFGVSEKKVKKMMYRDSSKPLKKYGFITTIAWLISCLTFITVIIVLVIMYEPAANSCYPL